MGILTILQHLGSCLEATVIRQLSSITTVNLAMSARIAMLGLPRWTGNGRFSDSTFGPTDNYQLWNPWNHFV